MEKIKAFTILLLAVISEYFHLLFYTGGNPVYHSKKTIKGIDYVYNWDDMVYYFTNELLILVIVIVLFFEIGKTAASKALMVSVVFWYLIEFIEIFLQLAKISDARLFINEGSWLQLSSCGTVSILVFFWNKKLSS